MAPEKPVLPPLQTERLQIVTFEPRHLTQAYVDWLNDDEVVRYSEQRHREHSLQSCRDYYASFENSSDLFLAIEMKDGTNPHIGNMTIVIDEPNGVADISILLGERGCWGKGYGLEAWSGVLNGLFTIPGIRKVTGGAAETNKAMVSIMRKCGMAEDGRRCGHLHMDGKPVDVVYFAAFAGSKSSSS